MKVTAARSLALQSLRVRAVDAARARRGLGLTGVREATAALLKSPIGADGYVRSQGVRQVPLQADRIVEPVDDRQIDMLAALPHDDAIYYSAEEHVVCREGKSEAIFRETEEHYGFVGGSLEEYLKYLVREDVQHLWEWDLLENVRAIAGVSTVPKKDQVHQRKLIMQVASNYMFEDVTNRAHLGMGGGSSLSRCFVEGNHMQVAAYDEDSAFTYVRIPQWMTYWQAGPPVKAALAWPLLAPDLRNKILDPDCTFVSPRYLRLAMGGSHSVYILMRINMHHIGSTLFNYASRIHLASNDHDVSDQDARLEPLATAEGEDPSSDMVHWIDDDAWVERQQQRRFGIKGMSVYTVDEWCDIVRRSKQFDCRTFVVIHMFAGERRSGDIQEHLENMMEHADLKLLMLSVDLAVDPNWDFRIPATFHKLLQLAEEGLIDLWLGRPPCSTVARARHVRLPGSSRPLRFRWALWGRPDLRCHERERLEEANELWLNFWAIADAVCGRGGGYLMEHPSDPGVSPYPSIWILPEVIELEKRANATRVHFHQCAFGGVSPKPTTLSGNLIGMDVIDGVWCPGLSVVHIHGQTIGRAPGDSCIRRLQAYPTSLSFAVAQMLFNTILKMSAKHTGPTGALSSHNSFPAPRVTAWSSWKNSVRPGVVLLNEATSKGQSLVVRHVQAATYVHVDDTVFVSRDGDHSCHCDRLMSETVAGLEAVGFKVSQQNKSGEVEKVVGYEVVNKPAEFRLPLRKMALLQIAMMGLAGQKFVSIDVLRSLVGMWIFGSLLRRELLSIPHSVFKFMEEHDGMVVAWWQSARDEVRAMARVTSLMVCQVGSPLLPWLFATDAMGANHVDHGGFGIVVTELDQSELGTVLKLGEAPGKSIARLDGGGGVKYPDKPLVPTVPFTMLPDSILDQTRWKPVAHGRWKYGDHITIGESRTVLKLVQRLAGWPALHNHAVFSLQDNRPTAGAMSKGRSPSFSLNRVLRQKAAWCLAAQIRLFLPWTESAKQPADELSRLQ